MTQSTQSISNYDDIVHREQNCKADIEPQHLMFQSSYQLLEHSAREYPERAALSMLMQAKPPFKLNTLNYRQLLAKVTQCANLLTSLGVQTDEPVAIILPNVAQTHIAIWGAQAAGIAMPINPLLEPKAIAELLRGSGAKIVITLAPFPNVDIWQNVTAAINEVAAIRHVLYVSLSAQLSGIVGVGAQLMQYRHSKKIYGSGGIASAVGENIRVENFDQAINKQNGERLISNRQFNIDDHAMYFCTSGTTGLPKIAIHSHKNELANVRQIMAHFGSGTISQQTVVLTALPLFHVNPVIATGLYPLMQGAHVILATPAGYRGENVIANFWQLVATHKVNFFGAVPTVYSALLNHPIGSSDISCLKYGICGAAPMPVQVFRDFETKTGVKILEGYGLTEGTCVSSVNPVGGARKVGSIGLRLPMQQMQIFDLDSLDDPQNVRVCNANELGVIALSGDNVFMGYKLAAQNEGIWIVEQSGKRWLNTGDVGYQDEEGYFYITGRKKEMIIRGGHNINPKVIEEVLYQHPDVAFAAAIGKPDAHAGELPMAFVELKKDAKATEQHLQEYAQQNIQERAAIPKEIKIIATMPLNTVGKVYKPALQKIAVEECFAECLQQANIKAEIKCEMHPIFGLQTQVVVADKQQLDAAQKALGIFAVLHKVE